MTNNIKYIMILTVFIALLGMLTLTFSAYSDQGKLESIIKENKDLVKRTNLELTKQQDTNLLLTKTMKERDKSYAKQSKELNKFRHETALLERELGSIVSGGNVDIINLRLCGILDRIEGNDVDTREARCAAAIKTSTTTSTYYKIDKTSVYNNLANWQRVASVIDQCFLLNTEPKP